MDNRQLTVAELIAKLSKLPADLPVYTGTWDAYNDEPDVIELFGTDIQVGSLLDFAPEGRFPEEMPDREIVLLGA